VIGLERRRFATSAGTLSYVEAGSGPAVVLLHGFPTSSYLWRREIPVLASRMRVIAPDLLGYGESDRTDQPALGVHAQARWIGELLDGLRVERPALVGHDVGGGVAQALAIEQPTSMLVLLDSIAFDAWPDRERAAMRDVPPKDRTNESANRHVRAFIEAGVARPGALLESDVEAYASPWLVEPDSLYAAAAALDGRGLEDAPGELAAAGAPLCVIWGEEDAVNPSVLAERLMDAVPGSTVAVLPGCGHLVTEDAPSTVGPLMLEFLRRWHLHEGHDHASGPVPIFLQRPPPGLDEPNEE
jgi:pimeloyl-ACP methyl ester carboxylesterase